MIRQFQQFFNNDFTNQTSLLNEVLFPVFGEDNFEKGYDVLTNDPEIQQKAAEAHIEEIKHLGTFSTNLAADIKLFEVVLSDNCQIERSRINIQQLIRRYVETFEGAFMVFHYKNPENRAWRFSYVEKRTSTTDATSAKRYTYLFGKDFACRTAAQRFFELYKLQQNITLQDITNAFSVEALTKEFYNELFNWYQWALSENGGFQPITFPNDTSTETDDRKIEEHIIRLVTRLMFVWFIKQKKLVPDDIFAIEPLKRIVKNFDPYSTGNGNYYNGILQNLFFATLNKAIKERAFANDSTNKEEGREHYGIKTLFRNPKGDSWFNISNNEVIQIFSKVPFLNGGLFECLDKEHDNKGKVMYFDGFSRETGRQRRAFIPNCLFFDPNKGIIPLLERYNFTIEENSPFEVQIALDPELLGKVFENLLASYNPETKTTARKQTGSFYTPREIVNYMVDESLIAYLNNCLCQTPEGSNVYRNEITIKRTTPEGSNIAQPDNSVNMSPRSCEEKLRQLLANNSDQNPFDANDTTLLIKALKSAKILDPACGSGAFPMGVLNRMVDLLQKLNDEEASTPYLQKLHLIQNCIYGVDIQTIAVQISKLRFFISLVCEQPRIENAENYGITPLPNLETKFVAANTLIGLEKSFSDKLDLGFSEIRELKDKLWNIRRQHFSARNADEKHQLRKHDEALRKAIEKQIIENASKPDPAKIERLQTEIQTLQTEKEKFVGERWESIVPPEAKQMSMFHNPTPEQQSLKIDKNKEERARIDNLIKEKQKELDKETAKTSQPGFENEAAQLAKWNPYDQNTTSPFFDAEWMFGSLNQVEIESDEIIVLNAQIEAINKQIEAINISLHLKHFPEIIKLQLISARNQTKIIQKELINIESNISSIYGSITSTISNIVGEQASFQYQINALNKKIDSLNARIKQVASELSLNNSIGFDIVIGNPPYVQLQKDGGKLAIELKPQNYETFEKTGDIYALFYEKGFQMLKNGGIHTFITSSQWMKAAYGKSLRKYFLKQNPLKLILLGPGAFENATVDTNIMIAQKSMNKKELKGTIINNNLTFLSEANFIAMPYITDASWAIIDNNKQAIKSKIEKKGKPLKDWDIKINFGIKTGINEVFIIDQSKRDELISIHNSADELIRPLLRGRTINKYHTDWDGDFIVATFPALQIDIEKHPSIKQYLKQFRPKIDQVGEEFVNEQGQKVKTRKKTSNEWFETQDQIGYVNEFKKEKIVWKRIGSQLRFSFLKDEIYCLDSTCIATGEKVKYLTALLNSKLCNYELFENAPKTGMGDLIISVQALEPLHVYYPNDKEEKQIVSLVDRILAAKKADPQADTSALEQQIDNLVYKLYQLTYNEVKVIDPAYALSEAEYAAIKLDEK